MPSATSSSHIQLHAFRPLEMHTPLAPESRARGFAATLILGACIGLGLLLAFGACTVEDELGHTQQSVTFCAGPNTVQGIDVSYYQGNINWSQVRAAGIDFAFIRVSHGVNTLDTQFAANWAGAKANGVLRGPYQYFESGQDPIEQANVMLAKLGDYGPGDLPPVIDVEDATNLPGAAQYVNRVHQWVDHVEAALGVRPIIYTGKYYWQDHLNNSSEFLDYPLWLAQYRSGCPDTPNAWPSWTFWQYTSQGRVDGIAGDVDRNIFNGTLDELKGYVAGGSCGDGICSGSESYGSCAQDCEPCQLIESEAVIDESSSCFRSGGNPAYMRKEQVGWEDSMIWTNATDLSADDNYGEWELVFAMAGSYQLEVYIPDTFAETKNAQYLLTSKQGQKVIEVDQSANSGWVSLGVFPFDAEVATLYLGDSTGESSEAKVEIAFDAIRLQRIEDDEEDLDTEEEEEEETNSGGCSISSQRHSSLDFSLLLLSLVLLERRRRGRRESTYVG